MSGSEPISSRQDELQLLSSTSESKIESSSFAVFLSSRTYTVSLLLFGQRGKGHFVAIASRTFSSCNRNRKIIAENDTKICQCDAIKTPSTLSKTQNINSHQRGFNIPILRTAKSRHNYSQSDVQE
uniref:Uncharacterized protein n=1 Tax=Romanomermis culicivorax TaxID=13658 RepID=A0A915I8W3_ROMCU